MLRLLPEVGFKFVVHDQFKVMFAPADGGPLGILEKLAAGAATGLPLCVGVGGVWVGMWVVRWTVVCGPSSGHACGLMGLSVL